MLRYHTKQGNFEVRGSLKNVEEELPKGLFAKCSNWCLVGLTHVAEIKDDTVIVEEMNCRSAAAVRKTL